MGTSAAVDWSAIDTVLLDMDGTLLDLSFDNWFWQEHIPCLYALARDLDADAARAVLRPKFQAAMGTIDWYCIDYWSRELGLDIGAIKRAAGSRVRFLPGALEFLTKLTASGKRRLLLTNAHPETLAIKNDHLRLTEHFDASYSTHPFRAPKEDPAFWPRLLRQETFEPARTLFVDDSLAVLDSARGFGIGWLRAVRCPDSGRPPKATGDYVAVDRVADLFG
jgi:putative hydrolase of the HAD superfamily